MPQTQEELLAQMLGSLNEMKQLMKDAAQSRANTPLTVRVEAGDHAVQELVNRVLEEILKRVQNENILHVTNS